VLTLKSIFITKISLLWFRKESRPYVRLEKIPIKTPTIMTPCRKEHSSAAAPMAMVYPNRNMPRPQPKHAGIMKTNRNSGSYVPLFFLVRYLMT
jgi:hypothetical protein